MSSISFSDWDLPEYILDALAVEGWEKPTQIQREAIPAARNGSDIIGQAKPVQGKQLHSESQLSKDRNQLDTPNRLFFVLPEN